MGNLARERAGFTLIELLIALVISGLLVGVVFQFMKGQGEFVQLQSSREEVQQNARAAVELISSELRSLPPEDGLVQAFRDSVTIRVPRAWGVICASPGVNQLDIALPILAGVSYTPNDSTGLVVDVGIGAPSWTAPVRVTAVGAPSSTCGGNPLPTGVERRTFSVNTLPLSTGGVPAVGNRAYLFDQVTYRTGTSSGVPGRWIQRRSSGAGNQPLAGPVPDGTEDARGLSFDYYSGTSNQPLPVPLSQSDRRQVNRVRVIVRTVSRNRTANQVQLETDTVVISLRNRG